MNKTIKFLVDENNAGKRVDVFLSKKIEFYTRTFIKKLIEQKNLRINGVITKTPASKIKTNDKIQINIVEKVESKLIPIKIKLDIIYEDKDILVINKPKGMVVHPGAGNYKNTLANALAYKYKKSHQILAGILDLELCIVLIKIQVGYLW